MVGWPSDADLSFEVHEESACRPLDQRSAKVEVDGDSLVGAVGMVLGTCWRRMNSASDGMIGRADWFRGISL